MFDVKCPIKGNTGYEIQILRKPFNWKKTVFILNFLKYTPAINFYLVMAMLFIYMFVISSLSVSIDLRITYAATSFKASVNSRWHNISDFKAITSTKCCFEQVVDMLRLTMAPW